MTKYGVPGEWYEGFPDSSVGKESTCNEGDPGLIPGLGRSAGEGIDYPLQYSWASLVAQLVKNLPVMQETLVRFLGREDALEKGLTTHSSILGLPCGSAGKESACNMGDLGLIPGLGRFRWKRERLPTPIFWPGEFHELCSLTLRVWHDWVTFHWSLIEEWGQGSTRITLRFLTRARECFSETKI